MAKRFTDTDKYKKPFIRGLQGAYKLLWDYLYHDCDHAGIWIVDFDIAQIYIGSDMPITKEDAIRFFNDKEEIRVVEFACGKKWFIPSFIEFQYGNLNPENRAHKSVISILSKYNLYSPSKGLLSPLEGCKDKDKDKDKDKGESEGKIVKVNGIFKKPTISEIKEYCVERGNNVDPNKWLDYYTSNGWMVGKNKMKDWKAAVRTWEGNEISIKRNLKKNLHPDYTDSSFD